LETNEFNLHVEIINSTLGKTNAKIILLHNPYNETQEKVIDGIIKKSDGKIIGTVSRDRENSKRVGNEIKEICSKDATRRLVKKVSGDKFDYIVIGQIKPKKTQGVM